MATTLEKIKTLLSMKKDHKVYSVKMYAEMILDDGRVLATEDEQFMIGSEVYVISDDGSAEKLSAGSYTMSDGSKMTVDESSKITDLGEDKAAEDVEKAPETEMEEEEKEEEEETKAEEEEIDEEKLAKAIDEATPDSVDKDKAKDMAKRVKEYAEEDKEDEEEKTEASKEEVVEMSKDMVTSLVEEVEHLKAKLTELEKTPGAEGFKHTPEGSKKRESINLSKLSIKERANYFVNNN
jgi:hypothetical protein